MNDQPGAVGPAVKGSSEDLLRAKVVQGTYPPNYKPQRPTAVMQPMPQLAEDIPAEALRSKDRKTIIPPLHGALLKNEQDVHLFERLVFMTRAKGA